MAIMEVTSMEVKHTSTFLMSSLYTALHDFLYEDGYSGDPDAGFPETFMYESRNQIIGKEFWVWWRFAKDVNIFGNNFAKILIHVDFHGVKVKDVEIMYQGKKIAAQKGKLEIIIRGYLEMDPGDKMKNGFLGKWRDIFINRYWRKEMHDYRAHVIGEMNKIRNFTADFINKPLVGIKQEQFYPKMGYQRENF